MDEDKPAPSGGADGSGTVQAGGEHDRGPGFRYVVPPPGGAHKHPIEIRFLDLDTQEPEIATGESRLSPGEAAKAVKLGRLTEFEASLATGEKWEPVEVGFSPIRRENSNRIPPEGLATNSPRVGADPQMIARLNSLAAHAGADLRRSDGWKHLCIHLLSVHDSKLAFKAPQPPPNAKTTEKVRLGRLFRLCWQPTEQETAAPGWADEMRAREEDPDSWNQRRHEDTFLQVIELERRRLQLKRYSTKNSDIETDEFKRLKDRIRKQLPRHNQLDDNYFSGLDRETYDQRIVLDYMKHINSLTLAANVVESGILDEIPDSQ